MRFRCDLETSRKRRAGASRPRNPRCAEPADALDVPVLGYDGGPSTLRRLGAAGR